MSCLDGGMLKTKFFGGKGRALMLVVRHKCRAQHARGKLQPTLCDNFVLKSALAKGRSSSALLNTTCRELCAVSIFNDISVAVRWLPSEDFLRPRVAYVQRSTA